MKWLVLAIVLAAAPAYADVQLWNEAGVRTPLAKRVMFTFDQHLRFDSDVSRVQSVMPEPAIHYRFKKWLRAGISYRFEYERDDGELVMRHRGAVYGRVRYKLGPLQLAYKLQYQESYRPDKNTVWKHVMRNRVELGMKATKRIEPGVSAEVFHRVGDGSAMQYEKLWLTVGAAYAKKKWDADVFYRWEKPADVMEPSVHIIGLAFHSDLPRGK